jgi:hypothetical protein
MVKYMDGNFGNAKSFLSFVALQIKLSGLRLWKYKKE